MANGNGETRKTITSLGREIADNRTSIEVLRTEIEENSLGGAGVGASFSVGNSMAYMGRNAVKIKMKYHVTKRI